MVEFHVSVMLHEAIEALQVRKDEKYIDCTLGGGGHTLEIAKKGGVVLSLDIDEDATENFARLVENNELDIQKRIRVIHGNFVNLSKLAKENGFENVSGVLFDLGVSSHQFDTSSRGFSIQSEGPLDMRMGKSLTVTAEDLVNALDVGELTMLFEHYGEERLAKRIASAIVVERMKKPVKTTKDLADIILKVVGRREKIHPATRVFQALRIAVNDELQGFKGALEQAKRIVGSGGRIVVISFHSLEDRIVKQSFQSFADQGSGKIVTKKPIVPTQLEVAQNARARSAKLRVFEKNII